MHTPAPAPFKLRDLFADPASGRLSHTRLWSNVGSAVATVLFAKIGWAGGLTGEVWAIYLAGVCGSAAVSKALSLRYRNQHQHQGYGYGGGYGYPDLGKGGM